MILILTEYDLIGGRDPETKNIHDFYTPDMSFLNKPEIVVYERNGEIVHIFKSRYVEKHTISYLKELGFKFKEDNFKTVN